MIAKIELVSDNVIHLQKKGVVMGLTIAIIAALFVALSNFFMRKSIDAGGSARAYLIVQLTFSFFLMIVVNPVMSGNYAVAEAPLLLGLLGGLFLGLLMWGMGRSLEKGPPGLTFAVVNSATVLPGIAMAILFGSTFGHDYTYIHALGSALVILGLFWAGWTSQENPNKKVWILFLIFIFFIHALFLVYLSWWALLLRTNLPPSILLPFTVDPTKASWFMPAVLFVAALMQWGIYLYHGWQKPKKKEFLFGVLGGITNGLGTYFLVLAPQKSAPWENAMLFPVFAVGIILICNGWAQLLYQEKVNWKANALALVGLVIGTMRF